MLINADDYGIGLETSRGILQLGVNRHITSSVVLVNSPQAEPSVQEWHAAGQPMELGWHPTLTIDRPLLPVHQVPTLVDAAGRFFKLGGFLQRLLTRRLRPAEMYAELLAQYRRCTDLLGQPPAIINTHHHIQIFPPIGAILKDIIRAQSPPPYKRLVREPWPMLWRIPGARFKRLVLNHFGRREARRQRAAGLLGNDWLIGVTNPPIVHDPEFFIRWVSRVPGNVVELTCHPGRYDPTLIGRDCTATDGMVERRVRELELLGQPDFLEACRRANFTLISPAQLRRIYTGEALAV